MIKSRRVRTNLLGGALALLALLGVGAWGWWVYGPRQLYKHAQQLDRAGREPEAIGWYIRAAQAGNIEALMLICMRHLEMGTDPENLDHLRKAMKCFGAAARKNNPEAMAMLGMMHATGVGFPPDNAQALTWLKRAADLGQPFAVTQMGKVYAEGLYGQQKSQEQALYWHQRALQIPPEELGKPLLYQYQNK